jgi:hypothetical protein
MPLWHSRPGIAAEDTARWRPVGPIRRAVSVWVMSLLLSREVGVEEDNGRPHKCVGAIRGDRAQTVPHSVRCRLRRELIERNASGDDERPSAARETSERLP